MLDADTLGGEPMSTDLLQPDAIGPRYVPGLRDGVTVVPVADEAVLYEEDTGRLHQLDAIATVIVGLFDGHATIEQTVTELAEAFGADRDVVERDVLALVQDLGRKGLFDDVAGEVVEEDHDDGC